MAVEGAGMGGGGECTAGMGREGGRENKYLNQSGLKFLPV